MGTPLPSPVLRTDYPLRTGGVGPPVRVAPAEGREQEE